MLDIPVRAALKEFQVALVSIKGKPASLTACPWDLLVRVADILEVQCPMFVSLVGQILWFAGNGVNLASCSPYFLNDALILVAP